MMASIIANDENKRETDEDNITKRLNKAFESRLDLDRVSKTLKLNTPIICIIRVDSVDVLHFNH